MESQQPAELERQAIGISKKLKALEEQQKLQTKYLLDISTAMKNIPAVMTLMRLTMILLLIIYAVKDGFF